MNAFLLIQPLVFFRPNLAPEKLLHDSPSTGFMVPLGVVKDLIPATRPRPWILTYRGFFLSGLLVMTFWLGWLISTMAPSKLMDGWPYASRIWGELLDIRFNYLFADINTKGFLFSITYFMAETIFMALFATVLGTLAAFRLNRCLSATRC